jgi:anti-sigma regulatory factor (Ser/Thr protein kinase)
MGRVGPDALVATAAYQPEPKAAAAARRFVRETLQAWAVAPAAGGPGPVDDAVLLTSELVTNAIRHEVGGTVKLIITCAYGRFRVDVHDTSRSVPVPVDEPADAETGRGLLLVANLSADWGYYWTPAGKAVYFVLAFEDDLDEGGGDHH